MDNKKFSLFQNQRYPNNISLEDKINNTEYFTDELDIYEIKLNKISIKLDSLTLLASKIQFENEKTNDAMTKQDVNIKNIDSLMQKQINIIDKLSEDINIYKSNLDKSIKTFSTNKSKLLDIVKFIKEIKKYILDIDISSNNMRNKSDNILTISKTIKKVADDSKLLSINAQIEASKISDKKNGFGVISDEMVKMADNTRNNSTLIDKTINSIIKNIEILNKNIQSNTNKIEESIALCEIIVDFVEDLSNEYKLNIQMFDEILNSMSEIVYFIEKINNAIYNGYEIAEGVFRNNSTEYLTIESFIEESSFCKKDTDILNQNLLKDNKILSKEKIKVLTIYNRVFNYDPIGILYDNEALMCKNIYNPLLEETKLGIITPILVSGWTDENSKVWTLYLKNNIHFSNGDLLTAEDVEFSLLRTFVKGLYISPETYDIIEGHKIFNSLEDALKEKISGLEVVDKFTLRISLKREDILFLNKLASENLFIISKKEYIKNNIALGSGAYYVDSLKEISDTDRVMTLKINTYSESSAYLKEIEVHISKNYDKYLNDVLNDKSDFDLINPLPFTHLKDFINKDTSMTLESGNSYSCLYANFIATSKNKLLQNKDFRQSVFSIINNIDLSIDGMNEYYIKNNALSTHWNIQKLNVPNWLGDKPKLSKLSGEINIVTYESFLAKNVCIKIKSLLERHGLKVNLHIDSFEGNLDNFDLSVSVLNHDAYNLYSQLYDSISPPLGSYLLDTEVGNKLKATTSMANYKQKNQLLKDIEFEILNEYYNLPICYTIDFALKKRNLINLSDDSITDIKFENLLKTI